MRTEPLELINDADFAKVDLRVGTIITAELFKEAKKRAYKLQIDFGPLGILKSSAQITKKYQPSELIGQQIIAVINFPKKQIANMQSECLVLGVVEDDNVTLLQPQQSVQNGLRIA
jgi:tRNA-binding protein